MSKSEILYMKGMMDMSGTEDDNEIEDIWDDKKLNDAYDKAVKIANVEVAKRVAMSTNTQYGLSGACNNSKKKDIKHSKPSCSKKKESWKPGMPCRAVYEGDGLEYEAFVLRIVNDKECVVRFLGYENSEIVTLNSLKPTLGNAERTSQIEQALKEKADEGFGGDRSPEYEGLDFSDRVQSSGSAEKLCPNKKKSSRKVKQKDKVLSNIGLPDMSMPNMSFIRNLGSMDMPIPPPPPMNFQAKSEDSEEQALSSMLLSWYMSGYYTGLYQGMMRKKENRRND